MVIWRRDDPEPLYVNPHCRRCGWVNDESAECCVMCGAELQLQEEIE